MLFLPAKVALHQLKHFALQKSCTELEDQSQICNIQYIFFGASVAKNRDSGM